MNRTKDQIKSAPQFDGAFVADDAYRSDVSSMCARVPAAARTRARSMDTASQVADTHRIDESPAVPEVTSERLARRWFALIRDGSYDRVREMLHEDVVIVSRVRPGEIVEGREAVASFIEDIVSRSLYEAVTDGYTPLDDARVIVEGRMRWIDEERVIRDDPAVWAMEFRDGLVLRFLPARSALEAETLLAAAPSESA